MDPKDLEVGETYKTTEVVNVCAYDASDCLMTDMIPLPAEYELTYVSPDADDGYVFQNADGMKFCLHDDDLTALS